MTDAITVTAIVLGYASVIGVLCAVMGRIRDRYETVGRRR